MEKRKSSLLPTTEPIEVTYRSIDDPNSDFRDLNIHDTTSNTTTVKSSFSRCKEIFLPTIHTYPTTSEDDDSSSSGSDSNDVPPKKKSAAVLSPRVMSDIIIGLSDGLTVPFALTAGLSSLGNSKLVITGGLAELISGAISMGLGGFLAAKSESEFYNNEVKRERALHNDKPEVSETCIEEILSEYNLSRETVKMFINEMSESPTQMIDFIIKFGKGLEEPASGREFTSALTIGASYFLGGFVPLIPYFFVHRVYEALIISVAVMLTTLFIFGVLKTTFTLGWDCGKGRIIFNGIQMVLIGSIAAGAAWGLVRLIA